MRTFEDIKIAVAGTGYVGLSLATLLSQKHTVTAVDIVPEKVEKIIRWRDSISRCGFCHHCCADKLRQSEELLRYHSGGSRD